MMRTEQVQRTPYEPLKRKLYAYRVTDSNIHEGLFKIGHTDRSVAKRIHEQVGTAGLNADLVLQVPAHHTDGRGFTDKDFHRFLIRKGIRQVNLNNSAAEWFAFDDDVTKLKEYLDEFIVRSPTKVQGTEEEHSGYVLRDEQEAAVAKTLQYMTTHSDAEFLWNAKPRFGKTLSSYDLVRRLKAYKREQGDMTAMNVLIVTNRPAIANSWYEDFVKFISWREEDLRFVSETSALEGTEALTRDAFVELAQKNTAKVYGCIAFVSLQDLKGARLAGGQYDKLQWIWGLSWNLMIIDESHEGIATDKTEKAFAHIRRNATLHLSGTPFKALARGQFTEEQIYNWTYMDEQEMKASWEQREKGIPTPVSPYADLPTLHMFTYRMGDAVVEKLKKGTKIGEKNVDYAFYLNEFFATDKKGRFIHEEDVRQFLDNLHQRHYPFSAGKHRDQLAHTFWLLQRVDSAKALAKMLREHPFFRDYYVVIAAGDGQDLRADNREGEVGRWDGWSEPALDRVRRAIADHDKTITLSVGQLTTGVTVPEWTAVLMLSDIESPERYFQAAFRAQNPYRYFDEATDTVYKKERAYVFDFAPERTLRLVETMATKLISGADTVATAERKEYIRRLLNYFPVIGEDEDGELGEFSVEDVMTVPLRNIARNVVERGFLSNELFTDIDRVIGAPQRILDILSKLSPDKNNKRQKPRTLEVPDSLVEEATGADIDIPRDTEPSPLGEGIWLNIPVDDDADAQRRWLEAAKKQQHEYVKTVVDTVDLTPVQEKYDLTTKEVAHVKQQVVKRAAKALVTHDKAHWQTIRDITESYDRKFDEIQTATAREQAEASKQAEIDAERQRYETSQQETLEREIRNADRIAQEMRRREKEKDVRDHLRGFSCSIPMFLMAYGDRRTTLANYDTIVDPQDFAEVTGITVEEFRLLRDGCIYLDDEGQEQRTGGYLNAEVFNASVQLFLDKKEALADYMADGQTEDIFDYIPQQQENRVFTPRAVVERMLDELERENPGIFGRKTLRYADLYVKSGMFLAGLVKRLYRGLRRAIPDERRRLEWILTHQIYAVAPTETLRRVAANYVYGAFDDRAKAQIKCCDFSKLSYADGPWSAAIKAEWRHIMKFDIIIGNPPYQEVTEDGNPNFGKPLYHLFIDKAYATADRVMLIHPSRFLFDAGATPKKWNKKMLADTHLKVIDYRPDAGEVFPSTDIKGGVCITYRDKSKTFGAVGVFVPFPELASILRKVQKLREKSISECIYEQTKFDLEALFSDFPEFRTLLGSNGKDRRLETNIFNRIPLFTKTKEEKDDLKIVGLINNRRVFRYISPQYIGKENNLNNYKVIIPKSNGSGALGEVISTPLIGSPLIGYTRSFISIGKFEKKEEAEAALKYVKTKFARVLLGILKVTQDNPQDRWQHVPLQDFTNQSDIDWTQSVADIDRQLYQKYKLTQKEIRFIEEKVTPME